MKYVISFFYTGLVLMQVTASLLPPEVGIGWKNGSAPLEQVVLAVRYRMKGDSAVLKPFIPGILMYGNPSNKGRTDGRVPVFAGGTRIAFGPDHGTP